MSRQWTSQEFETVLQNPHLSEDDLADKLPGRSKGAIGWVQAGIHAWHRGGDISMLSLIMQNRLKKAKNETCPKCGANIS